MDEKTAELRDIFVETTGSETVTERQEEGRGSLTADDRRVDDRVAELVATMRDRYDFASDFGDEDLRRVVYGFFDDEDDAAVASTLDGDADAGDVFRARMDLHLVRESDRDAPADWDDVRSLLLDGADDETCAAEFGVDVDAVGRYRRVVEAESEATRANDRFRDEFAELLTDSDLSARLAEDARRDGLREATEDIETDVSL
jgi:hypothetical protein